jgi:quinol monooxygenase YgiN
MIHPSKVVSIHPYFKVKPGLMTEARKHLSEMVARTSKETANLYYDFTVNGDIIFCREAYAGADALLVHLENVGPVLAEFLKSAEVLRVELHAAADELAKLKGPLAHLNPQYFEFYTGVTR